MKKLKLALSMLVIGVMMVGCSSSELSEIYDEETLKTDAQSTVEMLCDKNYESLDKKMSEIMKAEDATTVIKDAWEPVYEKLGNFESIDKLAVAGNSDLATVIVLGEFEDGKCQFTINYNAKMEIEGFFMK